MKEVLGGDGEVALGGGLLLLLTVSIYYTLRFIT